MIPETQTGQKETSVRFEKMLCLGILISVGASRADVIINVPPAGPPFYTDVGRLLDGSPYFFHDDVWAAFVFLRDPDCVPLNFNLLDAVNVPAVFGCELTVAGHAISKNAGDEIPAQVNLHGLGVVPVWFVRLSEVRAMLADDKITVGRLLASPSLRKGLANVYDETDLPGFSRPQGFGNGSIEVGASGFLPEGTSFQLEWRDMG
jgi:hypothetical protein